MQFKKVLQCSQFPHKLIQFINSIRINLLASRSTLHPGPHFFGFSQSVGVVPVLLHNHL